MFSPFYGRDRTNYTVWYCLWTTTILKKENPQMPMFSFTKDSFKTTSIENCNPNLWFPPGNFFGCVNLLLTLGWSNMATDHPPSSSRIFPWSNNQTALFPCWKPWLTWDFLYIFLGFPWDFPTFVPSSGLLKRRQSRPLWGVTLPRPVSTPQGLGASGFRTVCCSEWPVYRWFTVPSGNQTWQWQWEIPCKLRFWWENHP